MKKQIFIVAIGGAILGVFLVAFNIGDEIWNWKNFILGFCIFETGIQLGKEFQKRKTHPPQVSSPRPQ